MKKLISLTLAAGALTLAGCSTPDKHSSQWEYKFVPGIPNTQGSTGMAQWQQDQEALLNKMGADGWILVSDNENTFCFVRLKK